MLEGAAICLVNCVRSQCFGVGECIDTAAIITYLLGYMRRSPRDCEHPSTLRDYMPRRLYLPLKWCMIEESYYETVTWCEQGATASKGTLHTSYHEDNAIYIYSQRREQIPRSS